MRWGPGPVFIYECLTSSRRWQTYAARSFGVAALLVAMATIAWSNDAMLGGQIAAGIRAARRVLLLRADRRGAGAGDARRAGGDCRGDLPGPSRGTLAHMLATDLSDSEIVLGKLAARLLPVLGLVACTWPVLAISSLLGGIDPLALTMAFAVIIAVAVLGCTHGAGALGLGQEAARGRAGDLHILDPRLAHLADLDGLVEERAGRAASSVGCSWPTRSIWRLPPTPHRAGSPSGTIWASSPRRWGLRLAFTVLAVWRMRPVACRATGERPQGAGARPARPADPMAARSVPRRQSRALARMASLAAVPLDDESPRARGRDDRHCVRRRCGFVAWSDGLVTAHGAGDLR